MKAGNSLLNKFIILVLTGLTSIAFSSGPGKKTLNVGVVLRLNDKYNSTVSSLDTGIEVAKVLFEKEHPAVRINLKRYSIGEDLASSMTASAKIIEDKIPAAIGGEYSEESIVLGERLGQQKIIFITPTSSSPAVTENRPYTFRACFSDTVVAEKLSDFLVQKFKPKAVGLIHNLSSPYTDFLSKKFLETYDSHMAKEPENKRVPIYEEKILKDNQDFTSQIDHFIEKNVTHVVMLTHENDFLRFALQAANKKFFPIYVGSDGWGPNNKVFENFVKNSTYGDRFIAYRNSYWKEDSQSPRSKLFKAAYEKQIGRQPSAWSAVSFDAAWILFTAMDKVHNLKDGDEIQREMKKLKNLALVTSDHFTFGSDNSPRKDLQIYRIDKGGINYEATLK